MDARVYFIGKLLWAKGLEKLLKLQDCYRKSNCIYWEMNIFGTCWQTRSNSMHLFGEYISSCHCLELFSREPLTWPAPVVASGGGGQLLATQNMDLYPSCNQMR
jgi:hypothetical protein